MFVNNALHFPCVSYSALQRTLLFHSESIFPFSDSAHFALGLPLFLIPNPLEVAWNLVLAKQFQVHLGLVLHRALGLCLQWVASCLKALSLLWDLGCLQHPHSLGYPLLECAQKMILLSQVEDQDINPPWRLSIMQITPDPTSSIPNMMPLLNLKNNNLLLPLRETPSTVLRTYQSSVNTRTIECVIKGWRPTVHFEGCRGEACGSFSGNQYHLPLCPSTTYSWEFSNGTHILFHD